MGATLMTWVPPFALTLTSKSHARADNSTIRYVAPMRLADRLEATADPAKREQLIARLGAALDE